MPPLELTLILAATRDMGIGLNGTLPWAGLKTEMAYFARITKRSPQPPALNAVIMGRKTWDSIPPRFRPLKGRLNVVISRSTTSSLVAVQRPDDKEPVVAGSLEQALEYLERVREAGAITTGGLGKVFVIGGAQIYGAVLALRETRRILLTRITSDFECDTFFPLKLSEGEGEGGWRRSSHEELDAWVGETVPEGVQVEVGTGYEFQMWERVD
ncbi:dihydrofolate reductase-like domain-containing protein [Lasiosphaeria hispida]|uniref:Dihydrofolate reductase n=1 Tax=Lasiosphaeria hispida TaxID=260671 RepID=A0AAJ0MGK1_9PEZI|nr:dihydrofolate reductase-like domain-containing protein [Lasiosphaeria hispida]